MNRVRRLLHLSPTQLLQLCAISTLLIVAEISLRLWSFQTILRVLERRARRMPEGSHITPEALSPLTQLVEIADSHGIFQPSCLRRALVLAWWLGGRGVITTLRIGVAQDAGRLQAHAWVDVEGPTPASVFADPAYAVLVRAAPTTRLMTRTESVT